MFKLKLNRIIDQKNSLLCVGLDPDLNKIPPVIRKEKNPLLKFNQEIVMATCDLVAAYKPNIAFYETLGIQGWQLLEKTLDIIPSDILIIADAKRGDIGNSSCKYADTFFRRYNFDAITVSPYMGFDSVLPFLEFTERGIFILCLTSNSGSEDFQYLESDNKPLFLNVAEKVVRWNSIHNNCGLVVGATHTSDIQRVRNITPAIPLLIPGIGAQGGDLETAVTFGTDQQGKNLLINASRSILYASSDSNFAESAGRAALELRDKINKIRKNNI
jgi:orotidine-5'-phosphate decarboxylase